MLAYLGTVTVCDGTAPSKISPPRLPGLEGYMCGIVVLRMDHNNYHDHK